MPLAFYFIVRWLFFPQAIMLEDVRAGEGLKRSGDLVSGSWWRVAGIVLLITMISLALTVFLRFAVFPGVPGGFGGIGLASPPSIVSVAATCIIDALALPLVVSVETLLFFDLRWRRTVAAVAPA